MSDTVYVSKKGWKKKTIVETITVGINKWLKTIDDENLVEEIRNDYIITGGAIASMLMGDQPNDFDVYFQTVEVAEKLAKYYANKIHVNDKVSVHVQSGPDRVRIYIKSAGIIRGENDNLSDYEYFEQTDGSTIESFLNKADVKAKTPYALAMITSNAISLNNNIQIITRFVGKPEEIHKNYDYVHCTNWYTKKSGLVLNSDALEAILAKELRYVGSLYPICSMFRIKKFLARGWTITAGEMLKIAWDINKLNLDDINVLQEQLVGCDAAFFHQLLSVLKKESFETLDRTYLFSLITKVFDEVDLDHDVEESVEVFGNLEN